MSEISGCAVTKQFVNSNFWLCHVYYLVHHVEQLDTHQTDLHVKHGRTFTILFFKLVTSLKFRDVNTVNLPEVSFSIDVSASVLMPFV
jgi:hypothetical protein